MYIVRCKLQNLGFYYQTWGFPTSFETWGFCSAILCLTGPNPTDCEGMGPGALSLYSWLRDSPFTHRFTHRLVADLLLHAICHFVDPRMGQNISPAMRRVSRKCSATRPMEEPPWSSHTQRGKITLAIFCLFFKLETHLSFLLTYVEELAKKPNIGWTFVQTPVPFHCKWWIKWRWFSVPSLIVNLPLFLCQGAQWRKQPQVVT